MQKFPDQGSHFATAVIIPGPLTARPLGNSAFSSLIKVVWDGIFWAKVGFLLLICIDVCSVCVCGGVPSPPPPFEKWSEALLPGKQRVLPEGL